MCDEKKHEEAEKMFQEAVELYTEIEINPDETIDAIVKADNESGMTAHEMWENFIKQTREHAHIIFGEHTEERWAALFDECLVNYGYEISDDGVTLKKSEFVAECFAAASIAFSKDNLIKFLSPFIDLKDIEVLCENAKAVYYDTALELYPEKYDGIVTLSPKED